MSFYPLQIQTATPGAARDKAVKAHEKAVSTVCTRIAGSILSCLPYIPARGLELRTKGFARVLSHQIMHMPTSRLKWAEKALLEAADEQMALSPDKPPGPFQMTCDVGMALAMPGYLSYLERVGLEETPAFRVKGTDRVEYTIWEMEVQFALSEQWLHWAKGGFGPATKGPKLGDEWDDWTPPRTTIKRIWESTPEEEDRYGECCKVMDYLKHGIAILKRQLGIWDRKTGSKT